MRLLDTWTGQFVEKDPRDPEIRYAILSHTWDPKGEQTYQELRDIQRHHPRGVQSDPSGSTFAERLQGVSSPAPSPSQPSHPSSSTIPSVLVSSSSLDVLPDHAGVVLSTIWGDPELSPKIQKACAVARVNGHRYIWIDSCCIDKTSSSELSEAINSMYQWYSRAVVCFAFLSDVPAEEDLQSRGSRFRRSRWFRRGWTLQELIAPVAVLFLSSEWTFMGSKHSLADLVTEITGISYNALLRIEPLEEFSVAQRLSWAATRETTRVEDRAYSLLGVFDINMPTLYGEGHRAFRRLQEEIMRRIPDQSLFAWTSFSLDSPTDHHEPGSAIFQHVWYSRDIPGLDHPSLFAPSPDLFRDCGAIEPLSRDEVARRLQSRLDLPVADYYSTPYGIRAQFLVVPFSVYFPARHITDLDWTRDQTPFIPFSQWYLAILECGHKDYPQHLLARVCYTRPSSHAVEFSFCGYVEIGLSTTPHDANRRYDLLPLSSTSLQRLHSPQVKFTTVYISHAQERDGAFEVTRRTPHDTIKLVVLKKTRADLQAKGYTVDLRGPDSSHPNTHWLTLSHPTHSITLKFQHTLAGHSHNQTLTIASSLKVSGEGWGGASQADSLPWSPRLFGTSGIGGDIPGAGIWSIWEELTLVAKDHYAVHVKLEPQPSESESRPRRALMPAVWWAWMRACTEWSGRLAGRLRRATRSMFVAPERREITSCQSGRPYSEIDEGA